MAYSFTRPVIYIRNHHAPKKERGKSFLTRLSIVHDMEIQTKMHIFKYEKCYYVRIVIFLRVFFDNTVTFLFETL